MNTESVSGTNDIRSLRNQARLLQSVFDSLSDGVAAVDLEGRFVQFNPAGEALLGMGAIETPAEDRPRDYGLYKSDGKTPYTSEELPLVRASHGERIRDEEMLVRNATMSEDRWLKVSATPVIDERGELQGAVVLFRDDTETRRSRQALEAERNFLRHLLKAQDRDRQLTAYDLHDGAVQLVTGALLRVEAVLGRPGLRQGIPVAQQRQPNAQPGFENGVDQRADASTEDLTHASRHLREALDELRRLISGLRPPVIDEAGVVGALEYLVDLARSRDGIEVEFTHEGGSERLPQLVETTIFRIVQEALQNIARHAETSRARVRLEHLGDEIRLEIRDWGKGFDLKEKKRRRYGLRGIEERAGLLGGTAEFESHPGAGTAIRVSLPLRSNLSDHTDESES
jgi:signal transduction histidine kinase